MKHYFDTDSHEFQTPPDPYKGRSPMHNAGGTYTSIVSSGGSAVINQ